jgi:hypothetical protein
MMSLSGIIQREMIADGVFLDLNHNDMDRVVEQPAQRGSHRFRGAR